MTEMEPPGYVTAARWKRKGRCTGQALVTGTSTRTRAVSVAESVDARVRDFEH
jgi:hypothetical protein